MSVAHSDIGFATATRALGFSLFHCIYAIFGSCNVLVQIQLGFLFMLEQFWVVIAINVIAWVIKSQTIHNDT